MALRSFEGNTWVAFLDISGFKQMIKKPLQAESTLNKFYNTVYREVFRINHDFPFETYSTGNPSICSVVVSDCAILYVDNFDLGEDKIRDLHLILDVIKSINMALIDSDTPPQIMTTCALDYGQFKYSDRSSDIHTRKSFFYGSTYVKAYLGAEELSKFPGFCRVLTSDFVVPEELKNISPFNLLKSNSERYDFYWMVNIPEAIADFKNTYDNLAQSLYKQIAGLLLESSKKEEN